MQPEAEPWWRQAQADLETARTLLQTDRSYAASWFAQQAAEKALKALYLDRHRTLARRTHDLEYLGAQLQVPQAIEKDLSILNPAFDLVRYPDPGTGDAPVDIVTPELSIEHFAAAERILMWLEAQLRQP